MLGANRNTKIIFTATRLQTKCSRLTVPFVKLVKDGDVEDTYLDCGDDDDDDVCRAARGGVM